MSKPWPVTYFHKHLAFFWHHRLFDQWLSIVWNSYRLVLGEPITVHELCTDSWANADGVCGRRRCDRELRPGLQTYTHWWLPGELSACNAMRQLAQELRTARTASWREGELPTKHRTLLSSGTSCRQNLWQEGWNAPLSWWQGSLTQHRPVSRRGTNHPLTCHQGCTGLPNPKHTHTMYMTLCNFINCTYAYIIHTGTRL